LVSFREYPLYSQNRVLPLTQLKFAWKICCSDEFVTQLLLWPHKCTIHCCKWQCTIWEVFNPKIYFWSTLQHHTVFVSTCTTITWLQERSHSLEIETQTNFQCDWQQTALYLPRETIKCSLLNSHHLLIKIFLKSVFTGDVICCDLLFNSTLINFITTEVSYTLLINPISRRSRKYGNLPKIIYFKSVKFICGTACWVLE